MVKQPRRPQQEGVSEDMQQVDEVQPAGRDAERARAGVDVVVAGLHRHVAHAAARIANGQRDFGGIGAEEQIAQCDVSGVIGMLSERLFVHRHAGGEGQTVDRNDLVSRDNARAFCLRSDREAHHSAIGGRHGESGAAPEQQL